MKLTVDFSELHAAVALMGADKLDVGNPLRATLSAIDPIDIVLSSEGLEVHINEVEMQSGMLAFQGRQVLLYIQDHGTGVQEALDDGIKGNKFHVADCVTLKKMRAAGRFQRYVATNNIEGTFMISGSDYYSGQAVEGKTRLRVCKNCLSKLNYKGYSQGNRAKIFDAFSLTEFFETFSSFFPHMPKRMAGNNDSLYTDDWPQLSARCKALKNYICESCHVDLSDHKHLLHVHHRNGVKTDNSASNLQVLCADCHRKQPLHDWMFVKHADTQLINRLRRHQKGDNARINWDQAFVFADPGVHGVLHLARAKGMPPPRIGYEINDATQGLVAELELAWPGRRMGVAISDQDVIAANKKGWRVWSMIEALEHF